MKRVLIQNGALVTPDGILDGKTLSLCDGKIESLAYTGAACDSEVMDAEGGYVLPGFVDIHVHGGGGHDFMDATVDDFEGAIKAHLAHGTTTLYPTAMAASFEDLSAFLAAFHAFKEGSAYASLAPGVHLEGPYFYGGEKLSRGAQKGDVLRSPTVEETEALLALARGAIHRWDAAPELDGIATFGNRMRELGIVAAVAHTDATAAQAEAAYQNGFSHVTHFYNATSSHRKRGQTVYAGVNEATYLNDNVTVELIGDGCHIPKEDMLLAMKIKGREGVSVITDGMRLSASSLQSGKLGSLHAGTEVIVDNGVAKLLDMSSFAGSIATMDRCLRVLCQSYGISLSDASVMLSLAPALRMGISARKGSIAAGKDADLLIFDRELTLKRVILGGKTVVEI